MAGNCNANKACIILIMFCRSFTNSKGWEFEIPIAYLGCHRRSHCLWQTPTASPRVCSATESQLQEAVPKQKKAGAPKTLKSVFVFNTNPKWHNLKTPKRRKTPEASLIISQIWGMWSWQPLLLSWPLGWLTLVPLASAKRGIHRREMMARPKRTWKNPT